MKYRESSSDSFSVPERWPRSADGPLLWGDVSRDSADFSLERLLLPLATLLLRRSSGTADGPITATFHDAMDEEVLGTKGNREEEQQPPHKRRTSERFESKGPAGETLHWATREGHQHNHQLKDSLWASASSVADASRREGARYVPPATPKGGGPPSSDRGATGLGRPSSHPQNMAPEPSMPRGIATSADGPEASSISRKPFTPSARKNQEPKVPTSKSPSPMPKAQMSLAREDLLNYLRDQTIKANEERRQRAVQAAAAAHRPGEGLRLFVASIPTAKQRARSQPPMMRDAHEVVVASPMVAQPNRLKAEMTSDSAGEKHAMAEKKGTTTRSKDTSNDLPKERELREKGIGTAAAAANSPKAVFGPVAASTILSSLMGEPPAEQQHGKAEDEQKAACAAFVTLMEEPPSGRRRESKEGSFSSTVASTLYSTQQSRTGELCSKHDFDPAIGKCLHAQQDLLPPDRQQHMQGPMAPFGTGFSWGEGKQGTPCRRRTTKLLTVPLDPVVPLVVQMPPSNTESDDRRIHTDTFEGRSDELLKGLSGVNEGGGDSSPVLRSAILDPYASPMAHIRAPHSVFWGRTGAIGANGTPMVSPRLNAGPSGLGTGRTVDDLGVQRQSDLPFGVERHFQLSPNIALRSMDMGEIAGGEKGSNWRDKGEQLRTGARKFFGTPSLPTREPMPQGSQPTKLRDDIEKLRAFAKQRRGWSADTATREAPQVRPSRPVSDNSSPTRQSQPHRWQELSLGGLSGGAGKSPGITEIGDQPRLARQKAVGRSGTPMLVLRPLVHGLHTPQYTRSNLCRNVCPSDSFPAGFLSRQRHSSGKEEREGFDAGGNLHMMSSSISNCEGWDPLTHAGACGPVVVTMQETCPPSGMIQLWGREGAGAAGGPTVASFQDWAGDAESIGCENGWSPGMKCRRAENMHRIVEGEENPRSMEEWRRQGRGDKGTTE